MFTGKITSPPDGTKLTILSGSTVNITWTFDDEMSNVHVRSWYFTSSNGIRTGRLGAIYLNSQPEVQTDVLPRVDIIKPATLVLNNVIRNYDGKYEFSLSTRGGVAYNRVIVFIASKLY